jgi:hypothetical protein
MEGKEYLRRLAKEEKQKIHKSLTLAKIISKL